MKVAEDTSTTPVRVSVLLSASDAQRFEAYCRDRGFKKSTLIVRLIREHLNGERYPTQPSLFPDEGVRG